MKLTNKEKLSALKKAVEVMRNELQYLKGDTKTAYEVHILNLRRIAKEIITQ